MSGALPISARTPSRTIRLSSARNTEIFGPDMPLFEPRTGSRSREAATQLSRVLARLITDGWQGRPRPRSRVRSQYQKEFTDRRELAVRYQSSTKSVSWIPSEAIPGMMRLPLEVGPVHYDDP